MENGTIYVEDTHLASTGKIGKNFKLTKGLQELIGEVIQTMKCCKEFTEHLGHPKRNLMST